MNASPNRRPFGRSTGILSGLFILTVLASLPVQAAPRDDSATPITAARFAISIDGVEIASFSELAGITTKVDVIEMSGAQERTMQVTLKRGLTRNIEMAAWHELVILGEVAAARKSCSLTMYNTKGDPVIRYQLTDAWPSKIKIGALKDKDGVSVLTETITMTCEFIQRVAI